MRLIGRPLVVRLLSQYGNEMDSVQSNRKNLRPFLGAEKVAPNGVGTNTASWVWPATISFAFVYGETVLIRR